MTQVSIISNDAYKFEYIMMDGEPWFRGNNVAEILGCSDTKQAIRVHVMEDDKNNIRN